MPVPCFAIGDVKVLLSSQLAFLLLPEQHAKVLSEFSNICHRGRRAKIYKAAARLGISQPPLRAQIQTLEEELDLQLFNRTKHKVELTRAGELFLAEARLTLSQAQRTRKLASQLASGSIGEVRVGFTVSAALNPVIPRIFYNFRTENPAFSILFPA